jgi:branched-chain amino acid aminotransferase
MPSTRPAISDSNSESKVVINLDGEILPARDAKVSALDHGFLYGDSVYETLRTYRRRPFQLERHLKRLERSLEKISLTCPWTPARLGDEIHRTASAHGEIHGASGDVALRIVVCRGAGPISLDIALCEEPRCLIYCFPAQGPTAKQLQEGIAVVVSQVRRNHPSALDPAIKSGNFLNNILAFRDAKAASAQEALLLNADGYLAEGTTSNVFLASRRRLRTPGTHGILDGITRAVVIEEARAAGIEVDESGIPAQEIFNADEVFITSSIRGIVPVTRVDGRPIGSGRPGELTRELLGIYGRRVARDCGA